jgi:hypothetical protein
MASLKIVWNKEVCEAERAGTMIPPYIGHRHMLTILGAIIFEDDHFGIDFGETEEEQRAINIEGSEAQLALFKRCLENGDWPSEEEVADSAKHFLVEVNGEHRDGCAHYLGDVKRIASSIEIAP